MFNFVKVVGTPHKEQKLNFPPFDSSYALAFRQLNEYWIKEHFEMEDADYKALEYPAEYIIGPGGDIIIAELNEEVIGVCALIKMNSKTHDFELAKMAIRPSVRGIGLGYKLGLKTVERAKELGANSLYLESNTKLKPAINLYRKLGFKVIKGIPTPYARCNIQMELAL